jgi:hypothetical protein
MSIFKISVIVLFICSTIMSCKNSPPFKSSHANFFARDTFIKIIKFDTTAINPFHISFHAILNKTFRAHNLTGLLDTGSVQFFNETDTIFLKNVNLSFKLKHFFNIGIRDSQSVILFQSYIDPHKNILFFLLKIKKDKLQDLKSGEEFNLKDDFRYNQKKALRLYFKFEENKYRLSKII